MKRLFTFGCSFTQYWRWPTWADALGQQAEWFENWGMCGAGNAYMFYSLMECHQRYQLGSNDTVYVMWSNTSREDRYVRSRWLEGGNVYWLAGNALGKDYIKEFACERGYLIRDLAMISAARELLDKWKCEYRFFSMVPLVQTNSDSDLGENPWADPLDLSDVRDFYQSTLDKIEPSVLEVVFDGEWDRPNGIPDCNDQSRRDFHPTPVEHLRYLDYVMPGAIDDATRGWMNSADQRARSNTLHWSQPYRPTGRL